VRPWDCSYFSLSCNFVGRRENTLVCRAIFFEYDAGCLLGDEIVAALFLDEREFFHPSGTTQWHDPVEQQFQILIIYMWSVSVFNVVHRLSLSVKNG
jgi:hypothetical protein